MERAKRFFQKCQNNFETLGNFRPFLVGKWPQLTIPKLDKWKNATFDISKKILGPVHLLTKTDKWDYLRSPIIDFFFVSCFDIREVPRSPGKWNWDRLSFLPFIFIFEQCEWVLKHFKALMLKSKRGKMKFCQKQGFQKMLVSEFKYFSEGRV